MSTTPPPKYEDQDHAVLSRLAEEMGPFFVGPIDAQEFLNIFLPAPSALSSAPTFTPGMFKGFIDLLPGKESNLYDLFVSSDPRRLPHPFLGLFLPFQIKIISQHVRNLKVVKTSQANDEAPNSHFPFTLKPDCSVYQEDCDEENFDMSRVEFVIEFKSGPKEDPFVDEPKLKSTEELDPNSTEEFNPFVCTEGPTRTVLGQLTAYATAVLSAQYRTHTFIVFIVGEYARLI
jgi:hypothetical protein